jgi:YcxB-like protein
MHIVGELKMGYRSYRRLVLPAVPKWARIVPVLVAAFALLLVVALVVAGGGWSVLTPMLLVVVGAGSIEFGLLVGWRRMAKSADEPWRYVVTDSAVGVHSPISDSTTRWDSIRRARTLRNVWLLRLANKAPLPIPRAAFSADDAAQIDAFIAGRGARAR